MAKKFEYKNISGVDQVLIGYGLVKAEEKIVVDESIINQNFELIDPKEEKPKKNK